MKIDQQIDMVKLMRKSYLKEAKIWKKQNLLDAAYTCREYAKACTAVLGSLKRLKKLIDHVGKDVRP